MTSLKTTRQPPAKKAKPKTKLSDKEQSDRFKETARELDVDESGATFERAFRRAISVKNHPPSSKARSPRRTD